MFERLRIIAAVVAGIAAMLVITTIATRAAFPVVGSPIVVFALQNYVGTSTPPNAGDPGSFNTIAYGSVTPPPAQQQSGTPSSYDGTYTDITANGNQFTGEIQSSCTPFTYTNSPACAAPSSLPSNDFIAVQSWPFYVGSGTSSNVTTGTFNLQASTDDGSWFTLGGSPFTYSQPGSFNNTGTLTAGTAVLSNGGLHGASSVTSSFSIPSTGSCSSNLYYLTFEYMEGAGGAAVINYSWEAPGATSYTQPAEGVLWGVVLYNGAPDASATVKIPLPSGGSATLTTDANGCYGYDFTPTWAGAKTISNIVATDVKNGGTATQTQSTSVSMGCTIGSTSPCGTYLEFDLGKSVPNIVLYKRITQVVSGGVTTVPTPDPGPAGLAGTTKYATGLKPGDLVTYTIYFTNAGSIAAQPVALSGNAGPSISDVLPSSLTLQSATAATCCVNPTTSIAITSSTASNTATWKFAAPLPTSNPHSPQTIQGSVSVTGKVN